MKKVLDYLDKRGVRDSHYREFILSGEANQCPFKLASHKGYDYMVSHFLDASSKRGYGLIPTNAGLHMPDGQLAIGLVEGDDIICMDLQDSSIYLWLVQNGNGERLKVARSFAAFLSNIIDE